MSAPFIHTRLVEFRDTDAAGIAHFSMFFVWMEQAEHAALRHVGMSVMDHRAARVISWPRVSARCDYRSPVFFEQQLQIGVTIRNLGQKSVTYGFEFTCESRAVAEGELTTVCCELAESKKLTSIEIPGEIASKLQQLQAAK